MSGRGAVEAWMMTGPEQPFEKRSLERETPGPGEAIVAVRGCGVCHTDLSFVYHGVATRAELPLVLGHEISGVVEEVGEGVDAALCGRPVVVPAVLPCGECELCRRGERRICRRQIMPGNDRHGGYASHVTVPARYLCPVGDDVLARAELWQLAVVSDAVTTPFQAVRRAGLERGDLAVFIGAGGIGVHGVQIAAATGATVIALDVRPEKLETARKAGAAAVIDVSGLSVKEVRAKVKAEAKALGAPGSLWKIFETSGTAPGQEAAFALLCHGATLAVVGFTMARIEVRLSNLMAFDARAFGNWGCDPELYPEVLDWVAAGRIELAPYVEQRPLDEINDVFRAVHAGKVERRVVLTPA